MLEKWQCQVVGEGELCVLEVEMVGCGAASSNQGIDLLYVNYNRQRLKYSMHQNETEDKTD